MQYLWLILLALSLIGSAPLGVEARQHNDSKSISHNQAQKHDKDSKRKSSSKHKEVAKAKHKDSSRANSESSRAKHSSKESFDKDRRKNKDEVRASRRANKQAAREARVAKRHSAREDSKREARKNRHKATVEFKSSRKHDSKSKRRSRVSRHKESVDQKRALRLARAYEIERERLKDRRERAHQIRMSLRDHRLERQGLRNSEVAWWPTKKNRVTEDIDYTDTLPTKEQRHLRTSRSQRAKVYSELYAKQRKLSNSERASWIEHAKASQLKSYGIASWYGSDAHGGPTASGIKYDMYTFTAAHRTLPMGTVVKVTTRDSGKSVIVCVTDRGPYIDGRIIDLSYAAATQLGLRNKGVGDVKVEVVTNPQGKPLKPRQAFYVQYTTASRKYKAGPYKDFADASAMHEALRQAHPEAKVILE